jgi:hypothetical protein
MTKGVKRDTFIWGKKEHHLIESSQASTARPSVRSSMKVKMYEENVKVVTVVAWGKGGEILISH